MLNKCSPSGVLKAGEGCVTMMYNPVTKQFLGRTFHSWVRISVFYIVLYSIMAGFFTAHLMLSLTISGSSSVPLQLGQFGYFNYPNSKISLIATPNCATVTNGEVNLCHNNEKVQAKRLEQLWMYIKDVDYLPHSCRSWIQQPTATPNNSGCILISIQRVSTWTPEAISPILNTTHLPVQCKPSAIANTTVWKNTVFSVPSAGIPLYLDNSNGRTFPYLGQSDYSVAVYALIINGSNTEGFKGSMHITCTLDIAEQVGLSEAQLARIHDYPLAVEAVINYL